MNRLRNWLRTSLWKWAKKTEIKAKKDFLKKLEENPNAIKFERDETQACSHESLKKLTEATYQCQNKDCCMIIEILNDRSFYPEMFVTYTKKVKDVMKIKKIK